jgi:hypothetical protein
MKTQFGLGREALTTYTAVVRLAAPTGHDGDSGVVQGTDGNRVGERQMLYVAGVATTRARAPMPRYQIGHWKVLRLGMIEPEDIRDAEMLLNHNVTRNLHSIHLHRSG